MLENVEVKWLFGQPITRASGYTACEYANKMNDSDTQQYIPVTEQYHFFPYHHSPWSGYNNIYHCQIYSYFSFEFKRSVLVQNTRNCGCVLEVVYLPYL